MCSFHDISGNRGCWTSCRSSVDTREDGKKKYYTTTLSFINLMLTIPLRAHTAWSCLRIQRLCNKDNGLNQLVIVVLSRFNLALTAGSGDGVLFTSTVDDVLHLFSFKFIVLIILFSFFLIYCRTAVIPAMISRV